MTFTRELALLAATALAWFAYSITVNDPSESNPLILEVARVSAFVLSGIAVVRLVGLALIDGLVERVWGVPSTALMRFVVHLVFGVAATALILKYGLDFNITALLTTSALITAVIGLAAQSTMASLFSGISLQLERNFQPGGVIRVENRLAQVETIGLRSIRARHTDGTLVIVPNTTIAGNPQTLFRLGALLRTEVLIPTPISVPPSHVAEIIKGAVSSIDEVSGDHPISIELDAMRPQEGLVDCRVRCWARRVVIDDDPLAPIVRLRVWYAYQRHGIVMPRSRLHADPHELLPLTASTRIGPDEPIARIVSALAGARRWRDRDHAALERLVCCGRRLLYAPNEPILLPRTLDRAVAVLVAGEVRLSGLEPSVPNWIEPAAVNEDHDDLGPVVDWEIETLLNVEAKLGHAIGPYARLAVRQAAREATDLTTLYRRLATLIDDPASRAEFLRAAPQDAVRDFGPGTAFAVRCKGRGLASPGGALMALGPVELLAIPSEHLEDLHRNALSSAS
jgi:small-conductance mechanosensitive channel